MENGLLKKNNSGCIGEKPRVTRLVDKVLGDLKLKLQRI